MKVGFCVCGGFIARKPCDCSSARFSQVTKWDSENKKQAKYFENGNSNKWDLGQHFQKQATKWDPSLSRDYCRPPPGAPEGEVWDRETGREETRGRGRAGPAGELPTTGISPNSVDLIS